MHSFDIMESLEFGWQKTRAHSGLLFQVLLTFFALQVVSDIIDRVLGGTLVGGLADLACTVLNIVLSAGLIVIALKIAANHAAHYRDLYPKASVVWTFFAACVLSGLAIFVGVILLVLPGIFLMVRLSFVRFSAVDHGGITASLRRSWGMTSGHWWHLFGFLLVLLALNIAGALVFMVGLLVTIPVTFLAWTHVYEKLKNA